MARTISFYTDAALDAFNAGFSSKAAAKAASDDVTRAYELCKRELSDACLAEMRAARAARGDDADMSPAVNAVYWDVPSYPHQFKAKHADLVTAAFGARFDELLATIANLVELRDTIKAAVITPPVKDETKVVTARIVETIKALMARRNVQFLNAIDLSRVIDDKVFIRGLSANSHYVTNEHGTTFLRTFYFLNGALTPLNTIIAGAQETARRAKVAA